MLLLAMACAEPHGDSSPPLGSAPTTVASRCSSPAATPGWTDQAQAWGLVDTTDQDATRANGSNVALADLDQDGDDDVIVGLRAGGVAVQENLGDRLGQPTVLGQGSAPALGLADLDADGLLDLLVHSEGGEVRAWLNRGGLDFEQSSLGLDALQVIGDPRGFEVADVDGDADLDLYLHSGRDDLLLIRGPEGFEDASERLDLDEGWAWLSWGAAFTDLDRDGDPELYVSNDLQPEFEPSRLFWNEEGALERDTGACACESTVNSMGLSVGDVDGNGHIDLLVGSTWSLGLHLNQGDRSFVDGSAVWGLNGVYEVDEMSIGTLLEDVDLDGDVDLFLAGGRYGEGEVLANQGPGQPDLLLRNLDNTRFEVEHLLDDQADARGVATGDLNGDGWPDLLVGNVEAPSRLWLSDCTQERVSLSVELRDEGNTHALGALVELETDERVQVREIRSNPGMLAAQHPRAVFGLAPDEEVLALRVQWPWSADFEEVELDEVQPQLLIAR